MKCKVKVALGKVYLQKKEVEKGKLLVEMARDSIIELYSQDHPLVAKYSSSLIEALNSDPETEERT